MICQATLKAIDAISRIHLKAWQQSYKGLIGQAYLEAISFGERRTLREKNFTTPSSASETIFT